MESIAAAAASSPAVLACYVAALLLAALSYSVLLRRQRGSTPPLPPGPKGLPIVGSLPFLEPELHAYFARLARTYGPILSLRLGAKLAVVVSSATVAREVLRDQDAAFASRDVPSAALVISYGGADIAWSPNGPVWRMLRRACVREILAGASLDAAYGLRRREVRASVAELRAAAEAGRAVDVGVAAFTAAMNVMTSAMWGGTLGERREEVGREFKEVVAEITGLLGAVNVSDFFPALARFDLQGVERKMERLKVRLDGIFESIVQQRTASGGGGEKDFLEFMLRLEKESRDGGGGGEDKTPSFTMTHVKALLMDMVVGGTETSSNTVEWALAELLHNPATLRRAQAELDRVVGADAIVEESHIPHLSYLGAAVRETLRLHPALPLAVPHCPDSPRSVAGFAVPAGARVFINIWAIHRDPAVWDDPLRFNPDRFLGDEGKKYWDLNGIDLNYMPFGSGRRICAGMAMAERMVGYSLASLLHSFDWELPAGTKIDLAEKFGIVMKKARPLIAVPRTRLLKPELYS